MHDGAGSAGAVLVGACESVTYMADAPDLCADTLPGQGRSKIGRTAEICNRLYRLADPEHVAVVQIAFGLRLRHLTEKIL